jgi:hypothetical protein
MATQLPEAFDPGSQEGNSWELIPNGEYTAEIVEAGVLSPKNGDGYYVALTWKIIDGPYEGRQVWQRITFVHSSEIAQTIGRKTFKDLCSALGVNEHVKDVDVLLFKPARIKIGVEKDKTGQYDDKNCVKRIAPLDAPPQAAPAEKPQAAAPKPQPAAAKPAARSGPAGKPPWAQ